MENFLRHVKWNGSTFVSQPSWLLKFIQYYRLQEYLYPDTDLRLQKLIDQGISNRCSLFLKVELLSKKLEEDLSVWFGDYPLRHREALRRSSEWREYINSLFK